MDTVLIAVDGSALSEHAARFAGALLPQDQEVIVLHVADGATYGLSRGPIGGWGAAPIVPIAALSAQGLPAFGVTPDPGLDTELADRAHRTASTTAETLQQPATTEVEFSADVAGTICEVARREGAALIVLGTAQTKGISRWFHRSTAQQVVRDAPCAVLVVPETV